MKSTDHVAVLIDGDNVSSKIIAGLLTEVANYGTASVRRIYGDWTSPQMKSWRECLLEHSISPIQQFAYTTGKNATDGAMIIDAMDLMYTGRFSSFCIVSSDSDFTRLAARIREQGITVYGFGNRNNTHRAFVAACNEFVYFDVLPVQNAKADEAPAALRPDQRASLDSAMRRLSGPSASSITAGQIQRDPGPRPPPSMTRAHHAIPERSFELPLRPSSAQNQPEPRPLDDAALDAIRQAIVNTTPYEGDYVNLAEVGNHLVKISPSLNARNYGYLKLREFINASGLVDSKMKPMPAGPAVALVRLKS
ncbi:Putative NYN domain, MARF1-type, OST-HTH/LOTUS domain-containing protein [Septoria linicola]|uniref:NYN domain, MARF1-type, OST-HTH/LOTUS domain-containing protein n=1 Tax=Septoria linicola TaxID=215465 RepID=A0A9Q9ER53_9PEZI|nr:Putative NYN domain, MARF1-type, OST-HTH/LOTUS domain-containing protein [Septoria linicola]